LFNIAEGKQYKILFVADQGVGKTTMLLTYFRKKYTIQIDGQFQGINWFRKEFEKNNSTIILDIWDIAGEKRFLMYFAYIVPIVHAVIMPLICQKENR